MRRLAVTALVLGLLVGTTAAFALTEALKLERSPISRVRFAHVLSPTCGCPRSTAHLAFRLRRDDTLDAVMVDADDDAVRTLAEGSRRARGSVEFAWDGRTDDGSVVPDGSYRLRVHLEDDHRTIVVPNVVRVDTQAPAIEVSSFAPRRLSPDGDGVRDKARIVFRLSEPGRALLLVDGLLAVRGRNHDAGTAALVWRGTVDGRPVRAGLHTVALEAEDAAGNLSAATAETDVRIRYVEVAKAKLHAQRGGLLRFRILADAKRVRWTLFSRRGGDRRRVLAGAAAPGVVGARLPVRIRAGRYVLRVAANGHHDETIVVVRAGS